MSTFPSNDNASGIWTLKKQKRAVQAEAWPPGPFRSDNTYSVYFDGATDYLNVSDSSINLGTSSFTVEFWTYLETTANRGQFQMSGTVGGFSSFATGTLGLGSLNGTWYLYANNTFNITGTTGTVTTNRWHHIAIVRTDGIIKVYQNGTLIITSADTANYNTPHLALGGYYQAGYTHKGYITNFRIVKGLALYTTNFTPTTRPLAPINGTVLLTCQSPELVDRSVYNHAITPSGHAVRSNFSGFSDYPYWSNYFDGSGDYLSIPTTDGSLDATGDFTTELWIYWNSLPTTGYQNIAGQGAAGQNSYGLLSGNALTNSWATPHKFKLNVANVGDVLVGNTELVAKQWYHLAHTRSSGVNRLFVNGVLQTNTYTDSTSRGFNSNPYLIGNNSNAYISNFRYVKGTALYTTNFTPSTVPLTAVSGTSLLTCQNQEFVDNSEYNHSITVAGNTITTPTGPVVYDDGYWSVLFSSTNAAIETASAIISQTVYSAEAFIYPTSNTQGYIIAQYTAGNANRTVFLYRETSGILYFFHPTTGSLASGTIPLNTWSHVLITRDSGNRTRIFLNGKLTNTFTTAYTVEASSLSIGGNGDDTASPFSGYISNVRILNGSIPDDYVTQSSTVGEQIFSVPTTKLEAISNTSLLTCQSLGFKDNSANNHTITVTGNTTTKPINPFDTNHLTSPAGWSTYFDGSGDYILTNGTAYQNGTANWTLEAFIYSTSTSTLQMVYAYYTNTVDSISMRLNGNTRQITCDYRSTGQALISTITPANSILLNKWHHIVFIRDSLTTLKVYIDGILRATSTISASSSMNDTSIFTGSPSIGAKQNNVDWYFNGYISNVRLVMGTAIYTDEFTPPTKPLDLVSGTYALACQTAINQQSSLLGQSASYSVYGNAAPVPITPFLIENI